MSDTFKGFIITLRKPIGEEAADQFMGLLHALKNVASVNPVRDHAGDYITRQNEKLRILDAVTKAILCDKDERTPPV